MPDPLQTIVELSVAKLEKLEQQINKAVGLLDKLSGKREVDVQFRTTGFDQIERIDKILGKRVVDVEFTDRGSGQKLIQQLKEVEVQAGKTSRAVQQIAHTREELARLSDQFGEIGRRQAALNRELEKGGLSETAANRKQNLINKDKEFIREQQQAFRQEISSLEKILELREKISSARGAPFSPAAVAGANQESARASAQFQQFLQHQQAVQNFQQVSQIPSGFQQINIGAGETIREAQLRERRLQVQQQEAEAQRIRDLRAGARQGPVAQLELEDQSRRSAFRAQLAKEEQESAFIKARSAEAANIRNILGSGGGGGGGGPIDIQAFLAARSSETEKIRGILGTSLLDKEFNDFKSALTQEQELEGLFSGRIKKNSSSIRQLISALESQRAGFQSAQGEADLARDKQAFAGASEAIQRVDRRLDLLRERLQQVELAEVAKPQAAQIRKLNQQILQFKPEQLANFEEEKLAAGARLGFSPGQLAGLGGQIRGKPGLLEPGRLKDPETLIQLGFAAAFGGIPSLIGGVIGGATPLGAGGALLGSTLAQAGGSILFDRPLELLKEKQTEFKESGLAFQRSILGISAINESQSQLTTLGGAELPLPTALRARQSEATKIQLASRAKLLPLGIGGQTEATFVQGIVAALAQRGLQGTPEQIATIAQNIAGAVQAQRPSLLENTQQFLKDLQDVVGGGPAAKRTVLSQIVGRNVVSGIQRGGSVEEIAAATSPLAAQAVAAREANNPIVVINRLQGALDNLQTSAGLKILDALTPAFQKMTDVLTDPKVQESVGKIAEAFASLSAAGIVLSAKFLDVGSRIASALVDPIKILVPLLGAATAGIALYTIAVANSGRVATGSAVGAAAGGVINLATGNIGAAQAGAGLFSALNTGGLLGGLTVGGRAIGLGGLGAKLGGIGARLGGLAAAGGQLAAPALGTLSGAGLLAGQAGLVGLAGAGSVAGTTAILDSLGLANFGSLRGSDDLLGTLLSGGRNGGFFADTGADAAQERQFGDQASRIRQVKSQTTDFAKFQNALQRAGLKEEVTKAAAETPLETQIAELQTATGLPVGGTSGVDVASANASLDIRAKLERQRFENQLGSRVNLNTVGGRLEAEEARAGFIPKQTELAQQEISNIQKELAKERSPEGIKQRADAAKTALGLASQARAKAAFATQEEGIDSGERRVREAELKEAKEAEKKAKEELADAQKAVKGGKVDEDSKPIKDLLARQVEAEEKVEKLRQEGLEHIRNESGIIRDTFTRLVAPGIDQSTAQGSGRFQKANILNLNLQSSKLEDLMDKAKNPEERAEVLGLSGANQLETLRALDSQRRLGARGAEEAGFGIDRGGFGGATLSGLNRRQVLGEEGSAVGLGLADIEGKIRQARLVAPGSLTTAGLPGLLDERRRLQLEQTKLGPAQAENNRQVSLSRLSDVSEIENLKQSQKNLADVSFNLGQKFEELGDQVSQSKRALEDFDDSRRLRELGRTGSQVAAAQNFLRKGGSISEIRDPEVARLLSSPDALARFEKDQSLEQLKDVERRNDPFRSSAEEGEQRRGLVRGESRLEREKGQFGQQAQRERVSALTSELQQFVKTQGSGFKELPPALQTLLKGNAESAFTELKGLTGDFTAGLGINPTLTFDEFLKGGEKPGESLFDKIDKDKTSSADLGATESGGSTETPAVGKKTALLKGLGGSSLPKELLAKLKKESTPADIEAAATKKTSEESKQEKEGGVPAVSTAEKKEETSLAILKEIRDSLKSTKLADSMDTKFRSALQDAFS